MAIVQSIGVPVSGQLVSVRNRRYVVVDAFEVHSSMSGELLASADLLKLAGDNYEFLPNAEMDDMQTVVLAVGTTVSVIGEMKIHTGTRDKHGQPDIDSNSISTVVRVEP